MSDVISTAGGQDHKTLEKYLGHLEYDADEYSRSTCNLEPWTTAMIDSMVTHYGMDRKRITGAAYTMGYGVVRDEFGELLQKNTEMKEKLTTILSLCEYNIDANHDMLGKHSKLSYDLPAKREGSSTDNQHFAGKDSIVEEMNSNLRNGNNIKGGNHRAMLVLGLSTSENVSPLVRRVREQIMGDIRTATSSLFKTLQEDLIHFVSINNKEIRDGKLSDEQIRLIRECAELCSDENRERVEEDLDFFLPDDDSAE